MNKLLYISTAIAASAALTSCDDFLDTELLTQKTSGNFPATETEADEVLTGIYAHLLFEDPETSSAYYAAQLASDDCLGGNLSYSNNCATNFLMYTGSLNGYSGLWDRCYTLIHRANSALETLHNVQVWSSETEEKRHYGEVYFLRGITYYELAQMFGGVPLRLETSTDNLPRAEVDEVYYQIAEDLKQAIELLPNKNYFYGDAMTGHATKYAAEAYMARVFLFYTGRYGKTELPNGITKSQVVAWLEDCINNSGCELVSDQRNIWAYTNPTSQDNEGGFSYAYVVNNGLRWEGNSCKETLFANKHSLQSTWTYTWWTNTVCQFYSPSGDNNTSADGVSYPFGQGWGAGPVCPAMVKEWQAWSYQQEFLDGYTEDPRLTGSVWSYRAFDPNNKGTVIKDFRLCDDEPDYTVSTRYYEQTGYFNKKYINILAYNGSSCVNFGLVMYPGITSQTSQSLTSIQDLIHMRFADVLLMHSELTETADGLNKVRARSHLAPVSYSLENIKNERRFEFAFESLRWWDILRWSGPSLTEAGNLLNKQNDFQLINAAQLVNMVNFDYAARLQKTQGYWPIPQTEIDLSEGLLEQNPGWDASAMFSDWNNM
ncbi:MAG: RagB/SusD family nutrient uptake outer membrane protein [Bacteroidales bacterium]|nr:RagB/SusD family nutrient uptake outer membrane protein [Bacteroidales bacterium]